MVIPSGRPSIWSYCSTKWPGEPAIQIRTQGRTWPVRLQASKLPSPHLCGRSEVLIARGPARCARMDRISIQPLCRQPCRRSRSWTADASHGQRTRGLQSLRSYGQHLRRGAVSAADARQVRRGSPRGGCLQCGSRRRGTRRWHSPEWRDARICSRGPSTMAFLKIDPQWPEHGHHAAVSSWTGS